MSTLVGCGKKQPGSLDSAIVPGADFVARLDVETIRTSPIIQALKGDEDKSASIGFWNPFWAATGLTQDDVSGVVISIDLDNLDLAQTPPDSQLETLQAMMAFELKKPLTLDQLKAGVAAMDPTGRNAPAEVTVEKVLALKATEGGVVCMHGDGRYVFIAPNELCLGDTLKRFNKGKVEALAPAMASAFKALPGEPQVRAILVLTEALQAKLKADFEAKKQQSTSDFGAGMMMGMLSPIMDVKSLGLSVACSSNVSLSLGCVFTSLEAAAQMKTTIDMGLGMLMMAAQQKAPNQSSTLAQSVNITQTEKLLNISLNFTEADLTSLKSLQPPAGVTP